MSNFTERLTELMESAIKGDLRYDHIGTCSHTRKPYGNINPNFAESVYKDDFEYINFLVNRAPAIRDLVVAAEGIRDDLDERIGDGAKLNPGTMYALNALSEALAKLEEI